MPWLMPAPVRCPRGHVYQSSDPRLSCPICEADRQAEANETRRFWLGGLLAWTGGLVGWIVWILQ